MLFCYDFDMFNWCYIALIMFFSSNWRGKSREIFYPFRFVCLENMIASFYDPMLPYVLLD